MQVEQKFITDVDSWWISFKKFTQEKLYKFTQEKTISSTWKDFATKEDFPVIFSDFLFSSYGARYKKYFKFNGTLECNKPAPYILASKFKLSWKLLETPEEHRPARKAVKKESIKWEILILKIIL